jgi:hypothetical protein
MKWRCKRWPGRPSKPQSPTRPFAYSILRFPSGSLPITLKHASNTLRPLIRSFRLLLRRRMLRWRTVSSATRSRSGYHQPSTRHCQWLHADSGHGHPRRPSRHAQFYSELVPAMIPVALLGSAVYMVRSSNCLSNSGTLDWFLVFSI